MFYNYHIPDMNKELHISDVITRCIHNFVNELVINENVNGDKLKYCCDAHYNITITETNEKYVRWFVKNIYDEL